MPTNVQGMSATLVARALRFLLGVATMALLLAAVVAIFLTFVLPERPDEASREQQSAAR